MLAALHGALPYLRAVGLAPVGRTIQIKDGRGLRRAPEAKLQKTFCLPKGGPGLLPSPVLTQVAQVASLTAGAIPEANLAGRREATTQTIDRTPRTEVSLQLLSKWLATTLSTSSEGLEAKLLPQVKSQRYCPKNRKISAVKASGDSEWTKCPDPAMTFFS